MDKQQRSILMAVGIVALIAVIYLVAKQNPHFGGNKATNINKTDAPKGQLTQGFPKELILDSKAATDQSYTIAYDQNHQYTATLKSDTSPSALLKTYQTYLIKEGYKIVNQYSKDSTAAVYATKGTSIVNAVFVKNSKDNKTDITITYVK